LAGITGLLVRERKRKYLALGWLWFLGVLVPMIGIIQVGEQAMADRYMYIPMIGILISVVWFVWEIASEKSIPKVWIAAPAALIVAVLGVLTYRQLSYWKNGETLWRYTLNVTKDNYTAHANLAIALQRQGRVEEAIPEFQTAQALHAYPLPQVLTLAMYEQRYGHLREAVETYQKVVSHSADQELRAAALTGIGSANLQMKDYDQAKLSYQEALAADPKNVTALVGSGLMAERNGDIETSVAQLARAANLRPDDVGLLLLADALRRENRLAEAAKAEAYANKISPDWTQAQQNTAQALAAAGLSPQ
jgi:tetratricopeptide (TPR) repeat protein